MYNQHNNKPERKFLDIDPQEMAPLRFHDSSYFELMSADTSKIRDKHLVKQIENAMAQYDNVLVAMVVDI